MAANWVAVVEAEVSGSKACKSRGTVDEVSSLYR